MNYDQLADLTEMPMSPRLTKRLLNAMSEALASRIAGDLEDGGPEMEDYEAALEWVQAQIAKREKP